MGDLAISVRGLGKRYTLRASGTSAPYQTFREAIKRGLTRPFRRRDPRGELFWALKDVSFEVDRGEVLGIIGRNGAGKSTLLKLLSRITAPTEGEADVHGQVGSLLEVGTGFHPELSGRENTYLNGAILGMTRREIARKFDEIVAFAEVERFIDTPVKFYSSGMYVRLAFAVAAHLDPEVLIVDEVLSVGDAEFQKKCLGKMGEVAIGGRTVLFVSHQMNAVAALCSRAIVLTAGRIGYDGPAPAAVGRYLDQAAIAAAHLNDRRNASDWRVTSASLSAQVYRVGEPVEVQVRVEPGALSGRAFISALLINEHGAAVTQCDSRLVGFWLTGDRPVDARLRIGGVWLKPGSYRVDLFVCVQSGIVDHDERACAFEVSPILPFPHPAAADSAAAGLVLSDFDWAPVPAA